MLGFGRIGVDAVECRRRSLWCETIEWGVVVVGVGDVSEGFAFFAPAAAAAAEFLAGSDGRSLAAELPLLRRAGTLHQRLPVPGDAVSELFRDAYEPKPFLDLVFEIPAGLKAPVGARVHLWPGRKPRLGWLRGFSLAVQHPLELKVALQRLRPPRRRK